MNDFEIDSLYDEKENLSLIQRCGLIFTEPTRVFASMKEKESYWGVLLIYYVIAAISILLSLDTINASFSALEPSVLPFVKTITYITTAVTILIAPFFAGFLYHIFSMIRGYSGFNKTMRAYLYSAVISSLGGVLSLVISAILKINFSFSPIIFVDPIMRLELPYALLAQLNIFGIWTLVVFFIGMKTIHGMKKSDAIFTIAIPVVIGVLLTMVPYLIQNLV